MAATNPISASEFGAWMQSIGYFEPNPTIAIATSGGADSMALLLLAKNWVAAYGGTLISLTIDHKLRPEAAAEAAQVTQWCKKLAIRHETLVWNHAKTPISAIQASAREARYKLMLEYCNANNILHLLTAHHADDQVETLFFRLARGSGLDGLSGMSAQVIMSGVRLLRPLLLANKARLIATLKDNKQEWLEDPSNRNSLYSRVNIRNQLAQLPNSTTIKQSASAVINKFAMFRMLLENNLVSQLTNHVELYPMGYALLNKKNSTPQLLSAVIQALNGQQHPPRSEKLTNITLNSKQSLAGLIFEPLGDNKIMIYREAKAIEKPCTLAIDTAILWDNRFLLSWRSKQTKLQNLEVRALGSSGLSQIKKHLRNAPPDRVMRTIPSLWLLEELMAVPHIGYMSKKAILENIEYNITFRPAKPLAGSGFFINNHIVT